ncbi:MAG TPA: sulfatase-like hydrolase/transferase, partial [Bryobacteraceae bacterium]|nr:sulfatase-like hydrolase/transferase [Bryobacteraceae bacterium]
IFGNPQRNSKVQVSNSIRVSYPGYSEILTGRSQDAVIRGNDKIQNPTETVLEFVRKKKGLSRAQVALFASWDTFPFIGESQPGSVYINAGYQPVERTGSSARLRELGNLQSRIMTPWDSVRHDYFTFELAQEYLRSVKPSLLYLSLGETDDWAHDRRYDRVLTTVAYFDECLKNLWTTLQSLPEYRGVTTMIVTSDHGRGSTLQDWHGHGKTVEGADQIWLAIMGPDTPAGGEMHDTPAIFQRDVAPTILDLLDIGYQEYSGVEGHPISLATSGRK